jgi:hypothetical protein
MMNSNERLISVDKLKLIEKIKENRENHIKEYGEAVEAYKEEALRQLKKLTKEAKGGSLNVFLNLISPVNNTEKYDDLISQFEWDEKLQIQLTTYEFNEYIKDKTSWAVAANESNVFYSAGMGR